MRPKRKQFIDRTTEETLLKVTKKLQNNNTLTAYLNGFHDFIEWRGNSNFGSLLNTSESELRDYIDYCVGKFAPRTAKQRVSALRYLFEQLVLEGTLESNPAIALESPRLEGWSENRTITQADVLKMLASIPPDTIIDFHDRALLATLGVLRTPVSSVIVLNCEDIKIDSHSLSGGKGRDKIVFCPKSDLFSNVYISEYWHRIEENDDGSSPLFRERKLGSLELAQRRLTRSSAYEIIRRRAQAAGIRVKLDNNSFLDSTAFR